MDDVPKNLATVLVELRRAYRLVWAFQKRILSYKQVAFERLEFVAHEQEVYRAAEQSFHTKDPSRHPNLLFIDAEFRAYRRLEREVSKCAKQNDALLYIRVRADTEMSQFIRGNPSQTQFATAEKSNTTFQMSIIVNRETKQSPNIWEVSEDCRGLEPTAGQAIYKTKDGFSIFGMAADLSTLPNEATLLGFIDKFKDSAQAALEINFENFPRS